jgi:uncharacterized protein YkwD
MKIIKRMMYLFFVLQLCCTPTEFKHNDNFKADNNIEIITLEELDLLGLVNEYRNEHGVDRLNGDTIFHDVAYQRNIKNSEIVGYPYISHTGFVEAIQPIVSIGLTAGENLGYGYTSINSVFNAWIKSDGHRQNLLATKWLYTGISIYVDDNGNKYYCQIFVR